MRSNDGDIAASLILTEYATCHPPSSFTETWTPHLHHVMEHTKKWVFDGIWSELKRPLEPKGQPWDSVSPGCGHLPSRQKQSLTPPTWDTFPTHQLLSRKPWVQSAWKCPQGMRSCLFSRGGQIFSISRAATIIFRAFILFHDSSLKRHSFVPHFLPWLPQRWDCDLC